MEEPEFEHYGDAMVERQPPLGLPRPKRNGFCPPTSHRHVVDDPEVRKHLKRFAPWWKVVRLLKGVFFWVALAVVGVLLAVVTALTWHGWEPGPQEMVLWSLGLVVFAIALMTAFTGWLLRSDK